MNQTDLQQLLDRELKQLPVPRAPETLLPRVLAATVRRPAGAGETWLAWPRIWQIASAVALAVLVTGAWMLAATFHPGDWLWHASGADAPARVAGFARSAVDAATLGRVFWEVLLQPVATYVSVLAISFGLACALLWTALERFALGGASQR